MPKHINKIEILFFCVMLQAGASPIMLPADMHQWALKSIDYTYQEEFKLAENEAKRIIKHYPDHPSGYFFYAAVLDARMTFIQSEKEENEFYYYCNLAISKGEEMLEQFSDDTWAKFFMAGAYGLKGTFESKYQRWITAFRNGWQGVVIFRKLQKSDHEMADVLYGLGTYDYWRSALTKKLWWMPGVEDKREKAINMLFFARQLGTYVKLPCSAQLIQILCNEKRYNEALDIAENMITQYPVNLLFQWGKAESLLGLGRYENAHKCYMKILERIEKEQFESNYNIVLCRYYLGKVYFQQKKRDLCVKELKKMSSYSLSDDDRKRLEDYFDDAEDMLKEIKNER